MVPFLAALGSTVLLAGSPQSAPRTGRWLSYEQAFRVQPSRDSGEPVRDDILTTLPNVTGWLDDERYLELRTDKDKDRRLYAVRASDGSAQVYRDYVAMRAALPRGYDPRTATASPDRNRYVFTREGDLHLFDVTVNKLRSLSANPADERNARFSPDGKSLAYTRENNLYAYDIDNGLEHQLTTDGSETVYNGRASWVYFEEILGRPSEYAAFWWSPDSSKLAFMRFDDSPVPVFPIYHANGQHGELERQRYPKAGDPNPYVQLGIVGAGGGKIVWTDFEPKADHYIAWPFWTPDSKTLTVQWMNRAQDTIRFFNCDPATGKKTQIFEERQPSWVEFFEDLYYFRNGSGFLLRSNADGWDHLYYYVPDGTLTKRLTSGEWRVTGIAAVDERVVSSTSAPVRPAGCRAELFTVPSGDGHDLPAYWVLPPDSIQARSTPSSWLSTVARTQAACATRGSITRRTTGPSAA